MSPREEFLRTCKELPPLDRSIQIGTCPHTCVTRVNMGFKKAENIGMRSHYVRTVLQRWLKQILMTTQCAICKRNFKHDLKPHDPETRQRLWNALLDWDQEHRKLASIEKKRKHIQRFERVKEPAPTKVKQSPAASSGSRDFLLLQDNDVDDSDVEVVDVCGPSPSFRLPPACCSLTPQPSHRALLPGRQQLTLLASSTSWRATLRSSATFVVALSFPPPEAHSHPSSRAFPRTRRQLPLKDSSSTPLGVRWRLWMFVPGPFCLSLLTLTHLPGSFSSLWDPKWCDREAFGCERLCACPVCGV